MTSFANLSEEIKIQVELKESLWLSVTILRRAKSCWYYSWEAWSLELCVVCRWLYFASLFLIFFLVKFLFCRKPMPMEHLSMYGCFYCSGWNTIFHLICLNYVTKFWGFVIITLLQPTLVVFLLEESLNKLSQQQEWAAWVRSSHE